MTTTTKAAAQGEVTAQNNLGCMYKFGIGVTKDYKRAAELYKAAADQDSAESQFHLAGMYEAGQGVKKDIQKAQDLYQRSCDNGLNQSCKALAKLLDH